MKELETPQMEIERLEARVAELTQALKDAREALHYAAYWGFDDRTDSDLAEIARVLGED